QHSFTLRQIARTAAQHLRLRSSTSTDANDRTEPVAIRTCALEPKPQAVVGSAIVTQENRRSSVGRHDDIQIAIIVKVPVRRTSANSSLTHSRTKVLSHFCECTLPFVPEHMGKLRVLDPVLNMLNGAFEMTVGNKDIEPAIQIVVEEETAETECQQACASD